MLLYFNSIAFGILYLLYNIELFNMENVLLISVSHFILTLSKMISLSQEIRSVSYMSKNIVAYQALLRNLNNFPVCIQETFGNRLQIK